MEGRNTQLYEQPEQDFNARSQLAQQQQQYGRRTVQQNQPSALQNMAAPNNSRSVAAGRQRAPQSSAKESYFLQKVVLVTGASSGLGRSLAFWYLNNGARVFMVGRDLEQLDEIAKKYPSQSVAVKCDLTDDLALHDLKTAIAEKFGRLDIIINCAGVIQAGDVESTKPQDFDAMLDVNLRAPYILTHFMVDFLRESKGCVINISSDKGSKAEPGLIGYCMSKAGLEMLTKSSAIELAPFGIRVNAVAPSFMQTNLYRNTGMSEPELDALKLRATANNPMARVSQINEVAKSVIFLSTEHCIKMTGQIVAVDGGKSLTSRGQIDWYGWQYMNRKFEQETTSYYNYAMYRQNMPEPPSINDPERLEEWMAFVQDSVWNTKDEEAHCQQNQMYENQLEQKTHIDHIVDSHASGSMNNPKMAKSVQKQAQAGRF